MLDTESRHVHHQSLDRQRMMACMLARRNAWAAHHHRQVPAAAYHHHHGRPCHPCGVALRRHHRLRESPPAPASVAASRAFLAAFAAAHDIPTTRRHLLARVAADTIYACATGHPPGAPGGALEALYRDPMRRSWVYMNTAEVVPTAFPEGPQNARVVLFNADTIDVAMHLLKHGGVPRVAVLNMACPSHAGGGYLSGSAAQEESLFRRTNLYQFLDHRYLALQQELAGGTHVISGAAPPPPLHPVAHPSAIYPLAELGGVYSEGVLVLRHAQSRGYEFLANAASTTVDVISVAAINRPRLAESGRLAACDEATMAAKIRGIFDIALAHGHDTLVLGAFGCGAFRNPPRHVAELFRDTIASPAYQRRFRVLAFAIIEDENSRRGSEGNLPCFRDVLGVQHVIEIRGGV